MLGIEERDGERKATLRLVGEDGEYTLTQDGCILKDQVVFADNVSKGFPMKIAYRIDKGVHSIKQSILTLYLSKYRAFERGAKSIPQATSGSVPTTSVTSGSSSKSGTTSDTGLVFRTDFVDEHISNQWERVYVNEVSGGKSYIDTNDLIHSHDYEHDHHINLEHNHSVKIEGHDHTIEGHEHSLEYGIYESTLPSNIEVYVNGNLVKNSINSDTEVDITQFVKTNTVNEIKIYSQTNGRISANIWASMFNYW